jgi:hypothetical protein
MARTAGAERKPLEKPCEIITSDKKCQAGWRQFMVAARALPRQNGSISDMRSDLGGNLVLISHKNLSNVKT